MTTDSAGHTRRLEGRVVVLTGGSTGIGRGCAVAYAEAGASVVIGDVDEDGAAETIELITAVGGTAVFVPTDVSSSAQCENLVQEAVDRFGRLDVLHANAGIEHRTSLVDTTDEQWDRVIGINLSGAFYAARAAMRHMLETGTKGVITMTSSPHAFVTYRTIGAYAASKGGMVALSKAFALEGGPYGIRSNTIVPGATNTPMLEREIAMDADGDALAERLAVAQPLGRLGTPEDLAKVAVFLASDEAGFVTGSDVRVDGGLMAAVNSGSTTAWGND